MKFIVYSFVILVLAVMGIGAGLENSINEDENIQTAAIDTVYVDISKLLVLHPSYDSVKAYIESNKEKTTNQSIDISSSINIQRMSALDSVNIDLSERDRLANLAVLRAVSSLQELEYVTKENLSYCMSAEKNRFVDVQWKSINKESDFIINEAKKKSVNMQRDSLLDKLNAQIAMTAAISASNYYSVAFDDSKILDTKKRFDTINDSISSRNHEFLIEAENKISKLKESSKECPVINSFKDISCNEINKIVNSAQNETANDLLLFEQRYRKVQTKFSNVSNRSSMYSSINNTSKTKYADIKLDNEKSVEQELIDLMAKDIRREIRRISQERNINVTHTYSSGIKDNTQYFYKIMSSDGECVFRPIMAEALGGHS